MEAHDNFYNNGYYRSTNPQELRHTDTKPGDNFIVEDLFDFSNDDGVIGDKTFRESNESSPMATTVIGSCNSSNFNADTASQNLPEAQFSEELCVPYDDLAELEWLSNFTEDSFSSDEFHKLQLISGKLSSETNGVQPEPSRTNPIFTPDMSVPGKARSKRSRAAPCNWASRFFVLSPTTSSSESDDTSESGKKTPKKKENLTGSGSVLNCVVNSDGRKCLHCATDKTPQWRTGPMGPKTLCNACGVRFKSGRLVPEYRPASSPTFMLTKHSNSHRKVMELRRQKEMQQGSMHQPYMHPNTMFDVMNGEEYFIGHHAGSDFRHLV
ncbi:hypothetical protein GIB67_025343 [Kingdonia uniflora]|uniref:GATA transcription factor n=1 Tax=Kingdonia uniflora TaxID=39325 RepID=A0A7J7NBJ8_9MAGN|nr:hypothetical protein GIB67_025343 [Kingdonia uniflora]